LKPYNPVSNKYNSHKKRLPIPSDFPLYPFRSESIVELNHDRFPDDPHIRNEYLQKLQNIFDRVEILSRQIQTMNTITLETFQVAQTKSIYYDVAGLLDYNVLNRKNGSIEKCVIVSTESNIISSIIINNQSAFIDS
jgi:hypothetical protein